MSGFTCNANIHNIPSRRNNFCLFVKHLIRYACARDRVIASDSHVAIILLDSPAFEIAEASGKVSRI